MKKRVFLGKILGCLVGLLLVVILVLGSFGPAQAAAGAKPFKWPPVFRIGTSGTETTSFASTNGWAPKLEAAIGGSVRVIPVGNEVLRYVRLTEGKDFELDSISSSEVAFAIEGEGGYADKRAHPMRVVWHHNDTPWGFVVRGDSKFKTLYDLKTKGVKVAVAMSSPAMTTVSEEALPAFIGWTKEEAAKNWVFVRLGSYSENCKSVTEGKTDVSYVSPISSVTYEMEAHPKKLRWLPMTVTDKAAWKRWLAVRPTTIPNNIDWGVQSAVGVDGLTSNFVYFSRPDVDQEMVYQLAKWLNENFESYKSVHKAASRMSLKLFRSFLDYCPLPVAEGTVRYLKEIGQWTEKDDKWNREAVKLEDQWIKARNAALDEAASKGVKVHWESKEYLDIMKKHTAGLPPFKARVD